MRSEFKAIVVVGLLDSVAVLNLVENEINKQGEKIEGSVKTHVLTDMEVDGVTDWFHHIQPKKENRIVGSYSVQGKIHLQHGWPQYSDLVISKLEASN
ncbi:hypothetical protein LMH73_026380 [Vibrio splendidus]|nr:hypothetical protein [Vibrio splendidus]MCC4880874.1 hypothetical protein [Vibrio splendidus]